MLVGNKNEINITDYPERELIFFFISTSYVVHCSRWVAGNNLGKTDADVLLYKKQAHRKRRLVKEL